VLVGGFKSILIFIDTTFARSWSIFHINLKLNQETGYFLRLALGGFSLLLGREAQVVCAKGVATTTAALVYIELLLAYYIYTSIQFSAFSMRTKILTNVRLNSRISTPLIKREREMLFRRREKSISHALGALLLLKQAVNVLCC
jgi:hypothetical protein